jgi:hypothetical protein
MKAAFIKRYFQKYGRKGVIIYLCWCAIKGLLFLFLGLELFN